MDNKEALNLIDSMRWIKKASIFLLLLDYALRNLDSASGTQEKCQEAVDRCWQWLSDRGLSADELAYYLDSDEMQSGPLAEGNFASESVEQNSLILILLVVGFLLIGPIKLQDYKSKCLSRYVRLTRALLYILLIILSG
ncbi:Imm6 family immunity protein [Pseudomonas trivialis]